jgi:hypothetical protein
MLQADVLNNYWLEFTGLPTFNKFFEGDEVAAALPARIVGGAYDPQSDDSDDARFLPIEIFAVGDDEYLVPTETIWGAGGNVKKHIVRLNEAERIINRPLDEDGEPTRTVRKMERSKDIDPDVRESLRNIVNQRYKPEPGYRVQIIEPQPR